MRRSLLPLLSLLALGACKTAGSNEPATTNVRIAPPDADQTPVAAGDCVEARRRAALNPSLIVDRVPSPLTARPAPFQNPPRGAIGKNAKVKVDVLIDTLGRADMHTFKVVSATNPWLGKNLKSVMGKWTFSPAQLAGCKVPRIYHADIDVGGTHPRG